MLLFWTARLRISGLTRLILLLLEELGIVTGSRVDLGLQLVHVLQVLQLIGCLLTLVDQLMVTHLLFEIEVYFLFDRGVVVFDAI